MKIKKKSFAYRYSIVLFAFVLLVLGFLYFNTDTFKQQTSNLPFETPDPKREYSVTMNDNGWSTLTVPYYNYRISYPSEMEVTNRGGYLNKDEVPVATYGLSMKNNDAQTLVFGLTIEVDKVRSNSLLEEIKTIYGLSDETILKPITINNLKGYSFTQIAVHMQSPKTIVKYYVLDLGNGNYAKLQGFIGDEDRPKKYEQELNKIVDTFVSPLQ